MLCVGGTHDFITCRSFRSTVACCNTRISYLQRAFLSTVLLILASQRIETVLNTWFGRFVGGFEWISDDVTTKKGAPPTMIEWLILAWVLGNLACSSVLLLLLGCLFFVFKKIRTCQPPLEVIKSYVLSHNSNMTAHHYYLF